MLGDDCDHTLGKPICEAIGFDDTKVEFEITSNRPDCFSVIGLAREAAATFDKDAAPAHPRCQGRPWRYARRFWTSKLKSRTCAISISAKVVKNVRVKPSPRWMRERLRAMGVRPINNIVDITNYVMLEYGQPMHAFDLRLCRRCDRSAYAALKQAKRSPPWMAWTASSQRSMLVIADAHKPIAIAGVMGGEYSGIMDDTTTIVFESACFNGSSVRTTARDQGMRTDASARYEKGLDPNNCLPALERACELVEMLDAGDVMDGVIVDDHSSKERHRIHLDVDWINRFLDIEPFRRRNEGDIDKARLPV